MKMNWLTEELRLKVKKVFEQRYKKELTATEVEEIAINLSSFTENLIKFNWNNHYAK